jgi:hypothetical protein
LIRQRRFPTLAAAEENRCAPGLYRPAVAHRFIALDLILDRRVSIYCLPALTAWKFPGPLSMVWQSEWSTSWSLAWHRLGKTGCVAMWPPDTDERA